MSTPQRLGRLVPTRPGPRRDGRASHGPSRDDPSGKPMLPSPHPQHHAQRPFETPHRSPDLSVIVPTFSETPSVGPLIDALKTALEGTHWEVIFVDDDSPDGTAETVRSVAGSDRRVRCIRRIGRRGLAGASIEGMLSSSAPVVAVMDGDMQHDESLLPEMLRRIQAGADLVIASRFCESGSANDGLSQARLGGSRIATWLARRLLHIDVTDPMSGFFAMRRPVFEALAPRLSAQGFKILLDIIASVPEPLRTSEVPLSFRARRHGESKLDNLVAAEFLGLLAAKATGDVVSIRFVLFALVGGFGVLVHLAALKASLALGLAFAPAQTVAAYVAMTGNYFLNNALTYRDRRLGGWRLLWGLVTFCVLCSLGVIANVGVGQLVHEQSHVWWLAGLAGAAMGAIFNYVTTSRLTWRAR